MQYNRGEKNGRGPNPKYNSKPSSLRLSNKIYITEMKKTLGTNIYRNNI